MFQLSLPLLYSFFLAVYRGVCNIDEHYYAGWLIVRITALIGALLKYTQIVLNASIVVFLYLLQKSEELQTMSRVSTHISIDCLKQ